MSLEPEMPRWIFASMSDVFQTLADAISLKMYIEGQVRDTNKFTDFIEYRMDGPDEVEVSNGSWTLVVEINILITHGMEDGDFHRIHELVGQVQNMYTKTIPIYRYGIGVNDDQTFIGCMVLQQSFRGGRKSIEANHFGQINPKDLIQQATVEAEYRMQLIR